MSLEHLSADELRAARVDLDHQIAALRERKLEIARELEARLPEPGPEDRPAAQHVTPGFVEAEGGVFSPGGDPEPEPKPAKRRWRRERPR